MSFLKILRQAIALLLIYALPVATCPVEASVSPPAPQQQEQWKDAAPAPSPKIPNDQLDSLVAPIALYPDGLLAQILVASTYPLEIIQLQQWLDRNQGLKDQALRDAIDKENWDASVEALAPMPDVVKILSENIKWTTQLGDTFLAQQSDVMDAVQRMRAKAKNSGQLKSTSQQTVETKVIEDKTVVVIQPSKPDVIYVPTYDPMVVYGSPAYAYPYPPMYYPPGYYAAGMALSFGVGMAIGAAWGGCCGWGAGWGGGNNIYINNNNNFINHHNQINNLKTGQGNSNWQHNPEHRGGTPYGNRETANKYGGTARGDSVANRQANARQNQGLQQAGGRNGAGRTTAGSMDRGGFSGAQGGNRGGASTMDRGAGFGGGGDRVGGRDVSRGSGSGAFGGASSGMSNRSAGASQSRGASSMGSRSGGFSGGSGRSGGGRSGGGRRR